jgi:hypothetical protein
MFLTATTDAFPFARSVAASQERHCFLSPGLLYVFLIYRFDDSLTSSRFKPVDYWIHVAELYNIITAYN